jgi:hypothetical protein
MGAFSANLIGLFPQRSSSKHPMALHSTPEWRGQLRQFLNRRAWNYVRWADELNRRLVHGNRSLHLTEFTLTRWLNSVAGKGEYRGPKQREEYIDLAHALLQLQVITQAEARQWLLSQGLYPLPHEAPIFGPITAADTTPAPVADFRQVSCAK